MPEQKDMSGALFPNKWKKDGDNKPDYTGRVMVEGSEYELAGWRRKSKGGNPYMGLKVQVAEARDGGGGGGGQSRPEPAASDDDMPF